MCELWCVEGEKGGCSFLPSLAFKPHLNAYQRAEVSGARSRMGAWLGSVGGVARGRGLGSEADFWRRVVGFGSARGWTFGVAHGGASCGALSEKKAVVRFYHL